MLNQFARTELLLGREAMERLAASRVAVFGLGGVGSYTVEALARSGVGALDLVDRDTVSLTNLNRQLYALHSTVGRYKADVARERVLDINPDCDVRVWKVFYLPETADQFDFSLYDYVVDAVDTVKAKLSIIERARAAGTPVISAMGAGSKLDPTAFRVADIFRTQGCPLARIMRSECKKRGIRHLKVVFSPELPLRPKGGAAGGTGETPDPGRRDIPGSVAYVPSAAGLIIAGEVIRDLCGSRNPDPEKTEHTEEA